MSANGADRLRVATYNVHGWVGADGRRDPDRIMDVVASLDADVVALQEVLSPGRRSGKCCLTELAERLGMHATFGRTLLRNDAHYGNALLSKAAPIRVARHALDCLGHEPRGVLEAHIPFSGESVRVIATHLSLDRRERRCQLDTLHTLANGRDAGITLLLGDLNEWLPWGHIPRRLHDLFGAVRTPRTFPSRLPLFALDRILVRPKARLLSLEAVRDGAARVASDHLPLVGVVGSGATGRQEKRYPTITA